MKKLLIIILLTSGYILNAQKFMIVDRDTLALEYQMEVFKGDTFYNEPCPNFEIIEGRLCNYKDTNCLKDGLWIETIGNRVSYTNY